MRTFDIIRDLESQEDFVFGIESNRKCAKVGMFDRDNSLLLGGILLGLRQVSRLLSTLHFRRLGLSNSRI